MRDISEYRDRVRSRFGALVRAWDSFVDLVRSDVDPADTVYTLVNRLRDLEEAARGARLLMTEIAGRLVIREQELVWRRE